jgi:hypothetical protein
MSSLPPDLDRLGDQLTRAASSTLAARRRRHEQRRRVAMSGVIAALAFGALTPAALGPAARELGATALVAFTEPGCEYPHGPGVMLARCKPAERAVPHRPYAWR